MDKMEVTAAGPLPVHTGFPIKSEMTPVTILNSLLLLLKLALHKGLFFFLNKYHAHHVETASSYLLSTDCLNASP